MLVQPVNRTGSVKAAVGDNLGKFEINFEVLLAYQSARKV